jgi:hypothetical protein
MFHFEMWLSNYFAASLLTLFYIVFSVANFSHKADKRKDISAEKAAEEFHKVVHAFEILSDDNSRKYYDRTGRTQQQGAGGGGGGGSGFQGFNYGGFHFQWNTGGRRQYRPRKLKDKFKVQEAMSRVMSIVSLTQLETVMLDDNDLLERNLLMMFVTPQEVEQHADDEMVFPYPFAAMSEQGVSSAMPNSHYNVSALQAPVHQPTLPTLSFYVPPIFRFGGRSYCRR